MLVTAPSRLKLVDTNHVPSAVRANPKIMAFWADMSTGDEQRGLLYKFGALQPQKSSSIIHIQFIFLSDTHSLTLSFIFSFFVDRRTSFY